jgi:serine/threonine protein kinase/Tol biopolymer transport system component
MVEKRKSPEAAPDDGAVQPPWPSGAAAPATPPIPQSMIGNTVSHYRILERLGGGGMGVVYKGWDQRLERYAAIKFLSPHRSSSEDFKRRFAREARTASRLEHPNICTVFETDETDDGQLFIAMAFCEGESLKRKVQRGPLPLPEALSIAAQVAAGLAAAHDKGVVHRDVKPGNVMVAADGWVKIVDFGIARLADETRLTRTGDVMGTTAYIAPEQFLSDETDHRGDLWSLGVVLYEMVTGRLPWSGGDERELINAIVKRAPRPIATLRLEVPQELERIVARALAKRPSERYQRAEELRGDLLAVAALVARPTAAEPYEATVVEAPPPPSGPGEPVASGPAPPSSSPSPSDRGGSRSDLHGSPSDAGPSGDAAARGTAGDSLPPGGAASPSGGAGYPSGAGILSGPSGTGGPSGPGTEGGSGSPTGPASASSAGAVSSERRPGGGMIGRVVSHYRILAGLGGGGMGVVYQAQDLSLERVVALKFLPPELTRDPDAKARFLQEARAASTLDHPNICTIHEVGETDEGQLYLAMACYDGETLKQRLLRGRLHIDDALETAQQVARGLVKAHKHGIVHRDIKPANLMITADEIVKILDFGIAKLVGAAGLTRIGSSLGTPGYMSPEQARGDEVDPRTDVWSLGAVLYEMVTGRRPFRGDNDQAVIYALFNQQPEPVELLRPEAPPELVQIIGKMLEKDPDHRYPTAAAALADLRALYGPVTATGTRTGVVAMTGTTSVPALPRPEPRRRRRLWWAGLAAAVVLGGLLAAYWQLQSGPAGSRANRPQQAHHRRLTAFEGKETFPSISPNGDFFVFAKQLNGRWHVFFQRVGGTNPSDLTKDSTADDTQPALSPDGNLIAFRSEREGGGLFLMGATGESQRRLADFGFNPAWSPEGSEIVVATQGVENPVKHSGTISKLYRVKLDGGAPRLISNGDAVQPAWSPHGTRIAYWGIPSGTAQRVLWTIAADGSSPVRVTNDANLNWSPAWSADGRFLYYSSDRSGLLTLWRVPIDESSGKVLGEPEEVTMPAHSSGLFSFSRDGRSMIYASDETKSSLESLRFDPRSPAPVAGAREPIASGAHDVISASVSPDGRWITYLSSQPHENIFIIHLDGGGMRQITDDQWRNRVPVWSGDGSRIVFYSDRTKKYEAWAIRPDGSHLEQLTAVPGEAVYDTTLSPDGKLLACDLSIHGAALFDLGAPLDRRRPQLLSPMPGANASNTFTVGSWSPDGMRLSGTDSQHRIALYSLATRTYQRFDQRGARPVWLHDSRRLLYQAKGSMFLLDTGSGASQELLKSSPGSTFTAVGSSPDDRVLYLISATEEGNIWMSTLR